MAERERSSLGDPWGRPGRGAALHVNEIDCFFEGAALEELSGCADQRNEVIIDPDEAPVVIEGGRAVRGGHRARGILARGLQGACPEPAAFDDRGD